MALLALLIRSQRWIFREARLAAPQALGTAKSALIVLRGGRAPEQSVATAGTLARHVEGTSQDTWHLWASPGRGTVLPGPAMTWLSPSLRDQLCWPQPLQVAVSARSR